MRGCAQALKGLAGGFALGVTVLYASLVVYSLFVLYPRPLPFWVAAVPILGGLGAAAYAAALVRPGFGPAPWIGYGAMWLAGPLVTNYLIVAPLLLLAAPGLWAARQGPAE